MPGFGGKGKQRKESKKRMKKKNRFSLKNYETPSVEPTHSTALLSSAHNSHTIVRHGKTLNIILHSCNSFSAVSAAFHFNFSQTIVRNELNRMLLSCKYISQWKCYIPVILQSSDSHSHLCLTTESHTIPVQSKQNSNSERAGSAIVQRQ